MGGDDFDQVIIDYLADEFKKENNVDLRKDPQALQRLGNQQKKQKLNYLLQLKLKLISHL